MTPLYIQSVIAQVLSEIDVTQLPPAAAGMLSGMDPVSALTDSAASMIGAVQSNSGMGGDLATLIPILRGMFDDIA
jgi:hypothetical protein